MDGQHIPLGISQQKFSKNIQAVTSRTLDLPPSCIEFVPREKAPVELDPSSHYFVIGTYNLEKNDQTAARTAAESEGNDMIAVPPAPQERNGTLNLFSIRADKSLILVERLSYPSAILDLHFIPGEPIFAVASSTGAISIYTFSLVPQTVEIKPGNIGLKAWEWGIRHIKMHQVFATNVLVLSFIWLSYSTTADAPPLLAATTSAGEIYMISFSDWDFTGFQILNDELPINTHDAEAWCCAFCPSTHCLYSGGDDSWLRVIDLNLAALQEPESTDDLIGQANTIRGHDAGVTAILPLPYRQQRMFLTGSYDDHIRLYSWQNSSGCPLPKPREMTKLNLGGGVWKLKFLEDRPMRDGPGGHVKFRVLASCMHIGAKIVEVSLVGGGEWRMDVAAEVNVHESMCYGCDVLPLRSGVKAGDEVVEPEAKSQGKEGAMTVEVDGEEKRNSLKPPSSPGPGSWGGKLSPKF
ncbi:uncharacterized protein BP5553_08195 [Venustampulla echinocandica]|uniref:methylated diphthine methylhydrolase n=1 Tax=Venustampulla echinocandica TaxID=2656787 RepID=A0A370TFZ4_9HELO|nr:uncharacterized protein BP5553_08195 [Venustampulla echinocandica]RDL33827.1 hypothetical protein BP5553_08195 [Venustampulla echinocandica]